MILAKPIGVDYGVRKIQNHIATLIIRKRMTISRDDITQSILAYGFIEIGQIMSFLTYVSEQHPDDVDLSWIYRKVNQCLINHNDGSNYFDGLKRLQITIEAYFLNRA